MKIYTPGMKIKEQDTKAEKLQKQLKAAANGFLAAMKEVRASKTIEDRKYWLTRANRFKAYLERLGKNK